MQCHLPSWLVLPHPSRQLGQLLFPEESPSDHKALYASAHHPELKLGLPGGSVVKNLPANSGATGVVDSIPGSTLYWDPFTGSRSTLYCDPFTGSRSTLYCDPFTGSRSTLYCDPFTGSRSTLYCDPFTGSRSTLYCDPFTGSRSTVYLCF